MAARRNSRSVDESIVRLNGNTRFLGKIEATTAGVTNGNCPDTFNVPYPGLLQKILLCQPDVDCYINPGYWTGYVVTSDDGVMVRADERVIISMDDIDQVNRAAGEYYAWLGVAAVTGTVNLKVWELV